MTVAIRLENVSKCFRLHVDRPFLAKELFTRLLGRRTAMKEHWVLRDVSLEIAKGESVGIIGANGCGKTTLLSLITQSMYPTSGTVTVEGRVGSLLELGAGFHPDLTGIENIYLNASLLGLSRDEVDARLDSIVEFAGLGDFIRAPLHTYSSGMHARLGFAVVAHIDPEILLIDEVFAVGDANFQEKCEAAVQRFIAKGCTFLLVSHGLDQIARMCDRAIWLRDGGIAAIGPAQEVCDRYMAAVEENRAVAVAAGKS